MHWQHLYLCAHKYPCRTSWKVIQVIGHSSNLSLSCWAHSLISRITRTHHGWRCHTKQKRSSEWAVLHKILATNTERNLILRRRQEHQINIWKGAPRAHTHACCVCNILKIWQPPLECRSRARQPALSTIWITVHHIFDFPPHSRRQREAKKASAAFAFAWWRTGDDDSRFFPNMGIAPTLRLVSRAFHIVFYLFKNPRRAARFVLCAQQQKKIEVVRRNIRLLLHVTLRVVEKRQTILYDIRV